MDPCRVNETFEALHSNLSIQSVLASMAMEVIKSPLQPASQGAGGNYGNGPLSTQMGYSLSENCNPNMDKEAVTPGKSTGKKTPVKPKTATTSCENDFGKSPVRRRLDCDGGAHENAALGKSPAKASLLKEAGASPHKHFCRSPRCAANNPDYATPAPRQYLKSKRHLLPGWQPPANSKHKPPASLMRGENASHGLNPNHHEGSEEHHEGGGVSGEPSADNVLGAIDGEHIQADTHLHSETYVEVDGQDRGTELPSLPPVLSTSACEDLETIMVDVQDVSLAIKENDQAVMSTEMEKGLPLSSAQNVETSVLRTDETRESRNTESDFSMQSICEEGSDSRTHPPRRKGYHRMGGRRVSSGAASSQSISLKKQDGLKRKQAEDWMWDAAVKDAVQRLAPQGASSVNVLVKAFESVKLTEEEIQRSKYKNMALGRLVLEDSLGEGCGALEPHVSEMETISSINKVQAWDESMASAELFDEMNTHHQVRQDERNMTSTPQNMQARIPPISSKSEPPKVGINRWASDDCINAKDDTCSDIGLTSFSGKSGITEWTCATKSQAGRMHKQKLKRCTSLHPFRLRTEERGAIKEYIFSKRLQQLWDEEERLRIPIAQGLPWTTEEPEIPSKPPVKELTKPEEFRLITDIRAVERAEFDEYIAERNSQMELQRQEEERQRQIAEEEEVRRLRREMVPRAQLMPYFDRPFLPRKSSKKLTVPKEPRFHQKQKKRARCVASCHLITEIISQ